MKFLRHRGKTEGNGKSWYVKDTNKRNQVKSNKEPSYSSQFEGQLPNDNHFIRNPNTLWLGEKLR